MSDEEVLTEEESDALLDQSADSAPAASDAVLEPDDNFWEQVSVDRNPALELLNAGIADGLVRVWHKLFSREIVVSPQLPANTDGRKISTAIIFEESIRSFNLQPVESQCLLILQPDTVSAMVDICFGGPGSGTRSERLAALTGMERRMFARFCDGLRDELNDVWRAGGELALEDTGESFDSAAHPLCEAGNRSVTSRFLFDVGPDQHSLEIVWPQELTAVLNAKALKSLPAASAGREVDWSGRIGEQVKGANLELRAVIGDISVRLHEISKAKSGDVIMTDQIEKVRLYAGPRPVFEGKLGSHEGFNAVKITRPYIQNRSGDV